MKKLLSLLTLSLALPMAAQTPQAKPPSYSTETVTRMVAHCEAGWHLEQWHYGTDDMNHWVNAVYHSDPSGYQAVVDLPKSNPHPDRCVKDEPKKEPK
jgi:hypothetical protein